MTKAVVARVALFVGAIASALASLGLLLAGRLPLAALAAAVAVALDQLDRVLSRLRPVPMPHLMRAVLLLPRGPHSPRRLIALLQPRSGQRLLEIGPGIGVHALPVAERLLPGGVLHAFDIQQPMLVSLMGRATRRGLTNIVPRVGSAEALPYPDDAFDAAYAVGVLGEVPDRRAALRELRRVVKPDGSVLISELLLDPDFVAPAALRRLAAETGLAVSGIVGPAFAYTAQLRRREGMNSGCPAGP